MYCGHLGIALGFHAARPRAALAWFVGASLVPDLWSALLGIFGLTDAGAVYSHGVPQVVLVGVLLGFAAWRVTADAGAGILVGAAVLSHLAADYVTSTRLPLWTGGPEIGLRVYQLPLLDFCMEAALISLGWWAYRRATEPVVTRAWPQYIVLVALLALQAWFGTLGIT